jgi:hypothetical protein
MMNYQHKALAKYHIGRMRLTDLAERARDDERGEMGSWMILAAGLAAAAVTAVGLLTTWFGTKTTEITGN